MLAPLRWNRCLHFRTSLISSHLHSQLSPSSDSQQNPTSNADHVHIRRNNTERMQVVRWNRAIMDHMRSGRCDSARRIFDSMPYQDTVSWNSMMSGYLSSGRLDLAVDLFRRNPNKDVVSYNTMLKGYVCFNDLSSARKLFRDMPLKDVVSWNTMISACAQSGLLPEAQRLFDSTPDKNGISWNALLAGYLCNSRLDAARQIFDSNSQWELVSWNAMLAGYMRGKQTEAARELFDRMPERDVVSWNTMIAGFAQNGKLEEACKLFDITPIRDVFTWTSIVSAYSQKGMLKEARSVFDAMPERNVVSWNAMIAGYAKSWKMEEAKQLFDAMPCKNISTWNTVITGYAQSGDITSARKAFDEMPRRDSISWSAIIAAYTQGGLSEDALHMLKEMKKQGEKVNRSCFTCCLSTCADIAILDCGRQLHASLIKAGVEASSFVGNALLAMYCKCGSPDDAYDAFRDIRDKDLVSWNTMIFGYARHGFGKEALKMFGLMKETECKPDDITLVAVLSACSHSGLVDQGIEYFYTMHQNYGITAKAEHYTCMIDLLGRVGRLEEAENLMRNLPFEADATMWGALLGASRKHGNTMLGEKAAERIFEMEPDNAGMYVLLSNIYASSGKWSNVGKLRVAMRDKGVRKVPGFSWMEVMNKVHTFSVGDSLHPEINKIYSFLEELDLRLKKAGYVSSPKLVLHDVEEEEKEHMLKYHSEKLAVAYGLLKLPRGRPIRVMKNLRVCEDCHSAIKHISAIENRLIIIRDSNRFHHFHAGSCSCGDYW